MTFERARPVLKFSSQCLRLFSLQDQPYRFHQGQERQGEAHQYCFHNQ
jgi:hypothetical protein